VLLPAPLAFISLLEAAPVEDVEPVCDDAPVEAVLLLEPRLLLLLEPRLLLLVEAAVLSLDVEP
jgi:hypothetical protein